MSEAERRSHEIRSGGLHDGLDRLGHFDARRRHSAHVLPIEQFKPQRLRSEMLQRLLVFLSPQPDDVVALGEAALAIPAAQRVRRRLAGRHRDDHGPWVRRHQGRPSPGPHRPDAGRSRLAARGHLLHDLQRCPDESRNVRGLTRGDEVAVHHNLLVDDVGARFLEVGPIA